MPLLHLLYGTQRCQLPSSKRFKPGAYLMQARKRSGLSRRALSRVSGIGNGYLCRLEKDEISPSLSTLEEIAPSYGVTVEEIILGATGLVDPEAVRLLIELVRRHGQDVVRSYLDAATKRSPEELALLVRMASVLSDRPDWPEISKAADQAAKGKE